MVKVVDTDLNSRQRSSKILDSLVERDAMICAFDTHCLTNKKEEIQCIMGFCC